MGSFKKKKGFWQFFVNGFTLTRNQMFSLMDASKSRRILLDPMVIFSKGHNHNRKKWDLLKKKRDFDSFSWMDLLWPGTRCSHWWMQVKVDEFVSIQWVVSSRGPNHNRQKWDLLKKKRDFDSFSWMDLLWPGTRCSHWWMQVKVDEFY